MFIMRIVTMEIMEMTTTPSISAVEVSVVVVDASMGNVLLLLSLPFETAPRWPS